MRPRQLRLGNLPLTLRVYSEESASFNEAEATSPRKFLPSGIANDLEVEGFNEAEATSPRKLILRARLEGEAELASMRPRQLRLGN